MDTDRMILIMAMLSIGFVLGIGYDFVQTAARQLANNYFNRYFKPYTLKNYIESTKAWDEVEERLAE
jgi:hypothetical protein